MRINPPAINFNELILLKIKVNIMRRELVDRLYGITQAEDSNSMIDDINTLLDELDEDTLEQTLSHFTRESVLSMLPNTLSEMHNGNCTGLSYSCDRCYFEDLAEENTVVWSKQQGNECIHAYQENCTKEKL